MLVSHTVDFIRHLPKVAVLVNLASIGFWGRMAKYVSSHHCICLAVILALMDILIKYGVLSFEATAHTVIIGKNF